MIGDAAIGKVVDGLTDAVDSVTRVAGKAVRDKDMAERNQNAELIALWEQYRAEFGNANKGGFDAFVDGMNRLVRPVTAFSVLGAFGFLLWYGTQNPEGLVRLAQAVALIPAILWLIPITVLGFYFGWRGAKDWGQYVSGPKALMEATARVLQARDRIIWNDPPPPPGKPRRDDANYPEQ
jgi:hypothetical protein